MKYVFKNIIYFIHLFSLCFTATCAIDNSVVSTFNNRSYPIELGNCYHVLAMSVLNKYQQQSQESSENYNSQDEIAILARESAPQKKVIYHNKLLIIRI